MRGIGEVIAGAQVLDSHSLSSHILDIPYSPVIKVLAIGVRIFGSSVQSEDEAAPAVGIEIARASPDAVFTTSRSDESQQVIILSIDGDALRLKHIPRVVGAECSVIFTKCSVLCIRSIECVSVSEKRERLSIQVGRVSISHVRLISADSCVCGSVGNTVEQCSHVHSVVAIHSQRTIFGEVSIIERFHVAVSVDGAIASDELVDIVFHVRIIASSCRIRTDTVPYTKFSLCELPFMFFACPHDIHLYEEFLQRHGLSSRCIIVSMPNQRVHSRAVCLIVGIVEFISAGVERSTRIDRITGSVRDGQRVEEVVA